MHSMVSLLIVRSMCVSVCVSVCVCVCVFSPVRVPVYFKVQANNSAAVLVRLLSLLE